MFHFLASFSIDMKMTNVVARWKRFTSKHAKINWQRDFFDHRLRGDESWREKSDYILREPCSGWVDREIRSLAVRPVAGRKVGTHLRGVPNFSAANGDASEMHPKLVLSSKAIAPL